MAPERRTIRMELNRVEGDVEVRLELAAHEVTDAWCVGMMFRGFEQIRCRGAVNGGGRS